MNPFKEHCGHDVEIKVYQGVVGNEELRKIYSLYCKDCEEKIIGDEVFK